MQEFIAKLKSGKFRMPVCTSCGGAVWPPSLHCPNCYSRTVLKRVETTGTLLEHTKSHVIGNQGLFGLVEMSGFKLIGSFADLHLKPGIKVRMTACGLRPDGKAFYAFSPA